MFHKEGHHEIQLDVLISEPSSSRIALNLNSLPGINDDISSSTFWIVLILLSFTFKFSWHGVEKQNNYRNLRNKWR